MTELRRFKRHVTLKQVAGPTKEERWKRCTIPIRSSRSSTPRGLGAHADTWKASARWYRRLFRRCWMPPRLAKVRVYLTLAPVPESWAAFSDWAAMETFPEDLRERIYESALVNGSGFQRDGQFVMPNPAILVSAVK